MHACTQVLVCFGPGLCLFELQAWQPIYVHVRLQLTGYICLIVGVTPGLPYGCLLLCNTDLCESTASCISLAYRYTSWKEAIQYISATISQYSTRTSACASTAHTAIPSDCHKSEQTSAAALTGSSDQWVLEPVQCVSLACDSTCSSADGSAQQARPLWVVQVQRACNAPAPVVHLVRCRPHSSRRCQPVVCKHTALTTSRSAASSIPQCNGTL